MVRPDKSAVIFKYDGLGRRIEKSITRAGSEKVIPFARKEAAGEESKWETIGGVRIRRPNTELQKFHMLQGDNISVYGGENALQPGLEQKTSHVEKVIKFLWDGNVLLYEWQEDADGSKKPVPQIDYQADYVVKLSEKKKQEERQKAAKGEPAPESLVTWIFRKRSIVGTSTQAAAPYRAAYKSVCFLHSAGSLSDHGSRSSQNPVS